MITMAETLRCCSLDPANIQYRHGVGRVFANQNRRRGDLQAAVADLVNQAEALKECKMNIRTERRGKQRTATDVESPVSQSQWY